MVNNRIQELIEKRDKTDSGFDLPSPHEVVVPAHTTARVKLGVEATVTHEISFQKPSASGAGVRQVARLTGWHHVPAFPRRL